MKKIGIAVGGFFGGAALVAAVFCVLIFCTGIFGGKSAATGGKYEGAGYDSAEDAVKAYVEAFNEKDYDKMLSTFAVETYAEKYSVEEYVDYMQAYMPTMTMRYENVDEFTNNMLTQCRVGEIQKLMNYQYMEASGIRKNMKDSQESDVNQTIVVSDDASDFCDDIFEGAEDFSSVEIKVNDVLDAEDLIGSSYKSAKEQNKKREKSFKKIFGCDDIENVILSVSIDGEDYYLFAECLQYGDDWYINVFQSSDANYMGLDYTHAGLISEDEYEDVYER